MSTEALQIVIAVISGGTLVAAVMAFIRLGRLIERIEGLGKDIIRHENDLVEVWREINAIKGYPPARRPGGR